MYVGEMLYAGLKVHGDGTYIPQKKKFPRGGDLMKDLMWIFDAHYVTWNDSSS